MVAPPSWLDTQEQGGTAMAGAQGSVTSVLVALALWWGPARERGSRDGARFLLLRVRGIRDPPAVRTGAHPRGERGRRRRRGLSAAARAPATRPAASGRAGRAASRRCGSPRAR